MCFSSWISTYLVFRKVDSMYFIIRAHVILVRYGIKQPGWDSSCTCAIQGLNRSWLAFLFISHLCFLNKTSPICKLPWCTENVQSATRSLGHVICVTIGVWRLRAWTDCGTVPDLGLSVITHPRGPEIGTIIPKWLTVGRTQPFPGLCLLSTAPPSLPASGSSPISP